jgi:hypothetical protein
MFIILVRVIVLAVQSTAVGVIVLHDWRYFFRASTDTCSDSPCRPAEAST